MKKKRTHVSSKKSSQAELVRAVKKAHDRIVGTKLDPLRIKYGKGARGKDKS